MTVKDRHYIGGEWVEPAGRGSIDVIDPTTEEVIARVPDGNATDVDRAVAAARLAFATWSAVPVADRARRLQAVADGLAARAEEIAVLVSQEVGMPLAQSRMIQAGLPALDFGSMPGLLRAYDFEEEIGNSLVVREPIGVVGAITPWNYPLHQIAGKVAPALAAGCTVVLKPSEVAPLTAYLLAEVIEQAGLPAGVFNVVTGTGPVVGEAIAAHPGVDMVSFTGSTTAGRRVSEVAARTVKRVSLELGGKSASIILDDADLRTAVVHGVGKCFVNSGQTCVAPTRMLVPRDRLAEAETIAAAATAAYTLGDPFDEDTTLGPVVSQAQLARVRGYIETGIAEGAKLVAGGPHPLPLEDGYFIRPTVFSEVTPDMTIAREEIFGPVLAILPYDDEDEAVRIANDTVYGLSGAVWSADPARATDLARRLRTGQVDINGAAFNPVAPFGGYKQSGNGRELGRHGLEEFLETKAIQL
ncbi:aldehyde dehydrogenase family protein [Streptomyces sp. NPDC059874]|uniref:aldehyde dehydrogenase family protein n=1 Tax=Streptomyces sp. NPDC059874 TaxID=3346983 RepID=UPI00364DA788